MLKSSQCDATGSMAPDEEQFLKALGVRIAQLRRDHGLTQQAVADALDIAQQTYAHYEMGRIRMSVSLLPRIAQLFAVSIDDLLIGGKSGAGKRGPTPKMQQQIERLHQLPKAQQKVVMQMLDGVLNQANR